MRAGSRKLRHLQGKILGGVEVAVIHKQRAGHFKVQRRLLRQLADEMMMMEGTPVSSPTSCGSFWIR